MSLEEEWARYVAPFIKHPGCMSKDPVVAAAHLTNLRWMRAMGLDHSSICDPERNVRIFRRMVESDVRKPDGK